MRRARSRLAFEHSIPLPKSVNKRLTLRLRMRKGDKLRCTSSAIFIMIKGSRMAVTTLRLPLEDFADILVYKLMEIWP